MCGDGSTVRTFRSTIGIANLNFQQKVFQILQHNNKGRSLSHQFSNDEFKLEKFLQLIDTIKRTIFRKVRTEIILKIYNI
jgi:hypothetical protein